jgi:catechol 2,3-dioxygenase
VDASVHFYQEALGMELVQGREGMAFLSFGTQHHDVALFKVRGEPAQGTLGLSHVAFEMEGGMDELREAHQRLLDMGAPIRSVTDHGMTHSVYFFDPDGNRLEIYYDVFPSTKEGLEYLRTKTPGNKPLELSGARTN